MSEKEIINNLVNYIHNILDFVDVENFEEDNQKVVNGGYEEFVKPALDYLHKEQ